MHNQINRATDFSEEKQQKPYVDRHADGTVCGYVPLPNGQVAIVDIADLGLVFGHSWCAKKHQRRLYAAYNDMSGQTILMHRLVMGFPDILIDHASGNGLDNRRVNLRTASHAQNSANSRKQLGTASRFKGVSAHKGKWKARLQNDGKRAFLGVFASEEDAARAYDKAAKESFGEYAVLNFPGNGSESVPSGI